MIKKIIITATFFLIIINYLLILSCDHGNDKIEKKEIDSRLVGGKWYNSRGNTNPNSFFRFTETTYGIASNGEETIVLTPAYSENGKILALNGDTILLYYEFIMASYYDDELAEAISTDNHSIIYELNIKIQAAKSGNMVKFTIPGTSQSFEWTRWENVIHNPNVEIPSFLHGTWYRTIYQDTGKGLSTMLEKIIINDTSFTSFGYDHYVSEPVDITCFTNNFSIIFNNDVEYEVTFIARIPDKPNISSLEFKIKKYNTTGDIISLSTFDYDNTGNRIPLTLIYSRQQPTYVCMPEWVIGSYSTTSLSYQSYDMHIDYYPFNPKVYEFFFINQPIGFNGIVIREFRGYTPGTYPVYMERYYFNEILRSSTNKKADKTKFYFDEYFLERDLTNNVMYFGSINEDNIFFNKVFVIRRNDLRPVNY